MAIGNLGATAGDVWLRGRVDDSEIPGEMRKAGRRGGNSFSKAFGAALKVGAVGIAAAATFGVVAVNAASEFEESFNEVFTLLPDITAPAMKAMEDQALSLSSTMGILPDDVIPALYSSLSAGVPEDNVFAFLETAQKAAMGGVTDLETAVDAISSVTNAYTDGSVDATMASDQMFTAVRLGKTTFEELGSSLFNVTPTAAALGVQFGDVTASIASLTAQGVPTKIATTQMRAALVELGQDGSKAGDVFKSMTGQTFPEFIASGGDLGHAVNIMADAADGAGSTVMNMFGSVEAGGAFQALSADIDGFRSNLTAMGDSTGATEAAFEQMDTGVARALDRLKAKFEVFKIKAGQFLLPLVETAVNFVSDNAPKLIDSVKDIADEVIDFVQPIAEVWLPKIRDAIVDSWGFLIDDVLPEAIDLYEDVVAAITTSVEWLTENEDVALALGVAVGILVTGFVLATAATKAWTAATFAFNLVMSANPVTIVIIAIAALAAGIVVAYNRSETFREIVQELWAALQIGAEFAVEAFGAMIDFFSSTVQPYLESFAEDVGDYFMAIWAVIQSVVDLVVAVFSGEWAEAFDAMQALIGDMIDLGIAYFHAIPSRIISAAVAIAVAGAGLVTDHLWPAFVGGVEDMTNAAIDFLIGIPGKIIDLHVDIAEAGLGFGSAMVGGIVDGIAGGAGVALGFAQDVASALKSIINTEVIDRFNRAVEFDIGLPLGRKFSVNPPDIPHLAGGGVLHNPTLFVGGDAGSGNPEIVTPQRMMANTFAKVLASQNGGGGVTFEQGSIVVQVGSGSANDAAGAAQTIANAVAEKVAERQRRVMVRAGRGA